MSKALDAWIVGYFPPKHAVMGWEMKTLTFGHVCLMERMLCFPPKTIEEIVHCMHICGREFPDALEYVRTWQVDYEDDVVRMAKAISAETDKYMDSFMRYYDSNSAMLPSMTPFETEEEGGKKTKMGSPLLAVMRHLLISRLGYNPQTLDEAPYGKCMLDLQVLLESDGSLKIEGEDIDHARRVLEEAVKEFEESKESGCKSSDLKDSKVE